MSYRDNFSSDMQSPNSYSPSSNYGGNNASGRLGGNNGTYGGSNTPQRGFSSVAQSRAATSGFGAMRNQNDGLGRGSSVQSGPIPPALGPQGLLGSPLPRTYPPVTQEDIPGAMPQQPVAPDRNYPVPPRYVQPTRPMAPNVYGQPPQQMPRPNTTIPYNPNGGGYTNIFKNNQGNFGGYPNGNQATYARMGSDFRSIDSW
jgi:hypothetical protein